MEQEVRTKRAVEEIIIEQLKQGEKKGSELLKAVKEEGWSKTNFYYHLNKLIKERKVEKVGTEGKDGVYKLATKDEVKRANYITDEDIEVLERLKNIDVKFYYKYFNYLLTKDKFLENDRFREFTIEVIDNLDEALRILTNLSKFPCELKKEYVDLEFINKVKAKLYKLLERLQSEYEKVEVKRTDDGGVTHRVTNELEKKRRVLFPFVIRSLIAILERTKDESVLDKLLSFYFKIPIDYSTISHYLLRESNVGKEFRREIKERCFKEMENSDEIIREKAYELLEELMER